MSARHQPQTPKGFLFVTTEEEDALVNSFVGGSICQRSRTVMLNCFLLILKVTVQKQPEIHRVPAREQGRMRKCFT
jgi:hypothetical protein